ncbi:acetyl/propionyl/methylcrotonyl-CoA carboxylase subunit alpha [Actinokineospora diospyrosa]|uniref:biotin carboxylase n=1 Tax=Actinokineospora diospyrosa TaxID=103728 RepID=A0ABT1I7N9_9PSEU|nr:acetyl/propionyl/methylcrotonyl-CoA carboxylase subunit alpha [Actinokineospora diospyrosa]MCP2268649.1 acetyl-CoA/propionyl-CoA carboxylase, biotin carboxylase, biotin carboxyl carrier protein [Actinokineospora diospyrosa]
MFSSVLIANRGEIAVRVITTLRRMGIRSVAVYSDADAGARHVREADVAVRIGPAAARESYLAIDKVVAAALETGAEAVHPGYGFLAENVEFARACAAAGLVFIGPPASAIDAMGDKIRAKLTVSAAGVPVVPGRTEPGMSDDDLVAAAEEVGYPVLLKPSAGGGGKGMRLVEAADGLRAAIESARREARGSFGDETLLIERFVLRPRHIEIQVLADSHGHAIHLGERECSLQRRHQKIIEEAPSPLLDAATRARMGAAAVEAAKAVDYSGAGTVEFIVSADRPDEFFFMEMNTRLQVEHPVTEQVTGLDLVEQQVRVAAGERLALTQDEVVLRGHAVEARVYAEDPTTGFLPTGGRVLGVRSASADWARLDSGLLAGSVVGSDYDPMLAKVITWGADRAQAIDRLSAALASTAVLGVGTNIAFLRALLADADVRAGRLDTQLVERRLDELTKAEPVPDEVFAAAALDEFLSLQPGAGVVDPWSVPNGWRVGRAAAIPFRLTCGDRDVTVLVSGTPAAARVQVGDESPVDASVSRVDDELLVAVGGRNSRYARALDGDTLWLAAGGRTWAVAEHSALEGAAAAAGGGGPVTSPMPGTVLVVKVSAGERVVAGAPLLVVEAMKMEHTITAKVDGVVTELLVQAGNQVALNQTLAVVTPSEA